MKTTLLIRDDLLAAAMKETGLKEKTAVIHFGLEELLRAAARKRLVSLGGSLKNVAAPRRKRGTAARSA